KVMGKWVVVEHETQAGAAARRSAQTRAAAGKILDMVSTLGLKSRENSATNALRFGLRRIPEPHGKAEEQQAEFVNVVRGLNRRLAHGTSRKGFEALIPEFESAAARLRSMPAGEAPADGEQGEAQRLAADLYRPYSTQSVEQMRALINHLEGLYQPQTTFR